MELKISSFELCKQLMDVDFDYPTLDFVYLSEGNYDRYNCGYSPVNYNLDVRRNGTGWSANRISAPSLELAKTWVREVHNVNIILVTAKNSSDPDKKNWCYSLSGISIQAFNKTLYDSYDAALEAGLLDIVQELITIKYM